MLASAKLTTAHGQHLAASAQSHLLIAIHGRWAVRAARRWFIPNHAAPWPWGLYFDNAPVGLIIILIINKTGHAVGGFTLAS